MNIRSWIAIFIGATLLGLSSPSAHARIGDTEDQVILAHLGKKIDRSDIDTHAKVIVFIDNTTQHAVGLYDGCVEVEIFVNKDDSALRDDFVVNELRSYHEVWFPVECEDNCVGTMSADGTMYAKYGVSKSLRKQNVLMIFTETWRKYAKEKIETESKGVRL